MSKLGNTSKCTQQSKHTGLDGGPTEVNENLPDSVVAGLFAYDPKDFKYTKSLLEGCNSVCFSSFTFKNKES